MADASIRGRCAQTPVSDERERTKVPRRRSVLDGLDRSGAGYRTPASAGGSERDAAVNVSSSSPSFASLWAATAEVAAFVAFRQYAGRRPAPSRARQLIPNCWLVGSCVGWESVICGRIRGGFASIGVQTTRFLDPVASGNFGIWNQSSGRTLVARQATYRRRRRARPAAIDGRTRCRCQAAGVSRAPRALRARRCDSRRRGDSAWCAAAVAAKHLLDPAEPASPLERLAKARERGG